MKMALTLKDKIDPEPLRAFLKEQIDILLYMGKEMGRSSPEDFVFNNERYLATKINFYIKLHDFIEQRVINNQRIKDKSIFIPLIREYIKASEYFDRQIHRFDPTWPILD